MKLRLAVALTATLATTVSFATPAFASEVELINLYDAFGRDRQGLEKDFGFSMLVRYGDRTILFDSGTRADLFEKNLAALGIDPREIDFAVASHNHHDHISGFDYLLEVNPDLRLYLPNDFALGAPVELPIAGRDPEAGERLPAEQRYFDGQEKKVARIESTGRFRGRNVEFVNESRFVGEGIHLVVTHSELMGTFMAYPPFDEKPRLVPMPELSLSLATEKGEVLLVGCSHSGVEVIVEQARKELGRDIRLLAGGYHLLPYDGDYIEALARRLKDEHGVRQAAPAHCSGHLAFELFRQSYGENYRFLGLGSRLRLD